LYHFGLSVKSYLTIPMIEESN